MTKILAGSGLLIVAALILAALGTMAPPVQAPEIPGRIADIPLTEHAYRERVTEKYNARTLPRMYDGDQCLKKILVFCPKENNMKVLCEIHPDYWGGVVIGTLNPGRPEIVTGFSATGQYWLNCIKGCVPVAVP